MLDFNEAIAMVLHGTASVLQDNGFSAVIPQGTEKGALPTQVDGDHTYVDFAGDKGRIRFEFFGTQAILFYANATGEEIPDDALQKASTNYFDPESFEERDMKSLCNEFNDNINTKFSAQKAAKNRGGKMPVPVSRSAAKSGTQSYDGNTLANRLTAMYPELKAPYHENFETYGEFLPETFFVEHGTACILETIRDGQKQPCTKLFKILNDIYENGTNETQSLVAVTILGQMQNDPKLCETAKEYMCEDMCEPVLLINKYLATPKGKRAQEKMKNPPPYKPRKEKNPGMFAQAMAGAGGAGMPPM